MITKLVSLGLLLVSCGGRAATDHNVNESRGGASSSAGGTPSAALGGTTATGGDGAITTYEDGGTTVTLIPDDAAPDPSTELIHPGGPLGECDAVPCEAGLTCIQAWSYNPSYHVCSFKCAKPDSPDTVDPTLKAICEIHYAACRVADLQCIPQEPQTP